MSIIPFLNHLFAAPTFQPGVQVNQVRLGSLERSDGFVVAQLKDKVLVDWRRGGASVVPASELIAIG